MAIISQRVNFGVTRTLPDRNSASVTAKVATVASTAWSTIPCTTSLLMTMLSKYWLMPPRNTPSATAYAMTSPGLGTFLNALTRPSAKPTSMPTKYSCGATTQVTAPTPTTIASRLPVRTMTSSYVIRSVSQLVAEGARYLWSSAAESIPGCAIDTASSVDAGPVPRTALPLPKIGLELKNGLDIRTSAS